MQVEDCELSKKFIDLHIRDRPLVRPFIRESMSRASRSVQSWVDLHRRKVWLDKHMRKSEVSTHGSWWGGLGLGGEIQSSPGVVVIAGSR